MLHTVDATNWGGTTWCGPGVIATLTGMSVFAATEAIAKMQAVSATKVKGTYHAEMVHVLHKLGYSVRDIPLTDRYDRPPTVQRYLRERPPMEAVFPVVMTVTGSGGMTHFCAAHYGHFCDNWTLKPVPVAQMPKPRRRILCAARVIKNP